MRSSTPDREAVRGRFIEGAYRQAPRTADLDEAGAGFDRFLAAERADAARQALTDAADGVEIDLGRGWTGADDHNATAAAEVWLRQHRDTHYPQGDAR